MVKIYPFSPRAAGILWLCAAVFFAGCVLIGRALVKVRGELRFCRAALETVVREGQTGENMAQALVYAFGLSDPEAEAYAGQFRAAARRTGVSWEWMAAVCAVESGFNPTLTSKAKCRGLMQLKDSTMMVYCKRLGGKWRPGVTPWIDILNLRAGTEFLCDMVKKYGEERGVKAYLLGEPGMRAGRFSDDSGKYSDVVRERAKVFFLFEGISVCYPGRERRVLK